jgi:A/G-specific adenine glycosylase
LIETENKIEIEKLISEPEFHRIIHADDHTVIENISEWKSHLLSHQRIHYRFVRIQLNDVIQAADDLIRVNKEDIFNFAVPKLLEKCMDEYFGNR